MITPDEECRKAFNDLYPMLDALLGTDAAKHMRNVFHAGWLARVPAGHVVVPREPNYRISNMLTDRVSEWLNYIENYRQNMSYQEVLDMTTGTIERYHNNQIFRAKVDMLVSMLLHDYKTMLAASQGDE